MNIDLSAFTRLPLGHIPTPLEPLERLTAYLGGPEIWIKRDDCTGLAFGGNKTRKLEFLLGDAKSQNADTVITFGALQSNHVRQTIAACARTDFACHAILTDVVPHNEPAYRASGNLLLDRLGNAELHIVKSADDASDVLTHLTQSLTEKGQRVYIVPPGGSTAIGTLGYVSAGLEIADQAGRNNLAFDAVVCASSTGGTQAGLALALSQTNADTDVIGVNVYEKEVGTLNERVERLLADIADLLAIKRLPPARCLDGFLGNGYGLPTDAMREAVRNVFHHEGVLLDPVYSGKAMAALFSLCRDGTYSNTDKILFVHTGGAPGLFAYQDALLQPARHKN